MGTKKKPLATVERYDLLTDSWEIVHEMTLPMPLFSLNVFVVDRKIYLAGAMVVDRVKKSESILCLDTRDMTGGWSSFDLDIEADFGKGCQYGMLPLGDSKHGDKTWLLLFGGLLAYV